MKIEVMGVEIEDTTIERAVEKLEAWLRLEDRTRSVYFVNAHTLNCATDDPAYRALLNRSDVVFGDGTGVRWAARLHGVELQDNVNGTDLTPALLLRTSGYRYFLLGGDPGSSADAAEYCRQTFPGWELVGAQHGYFGAGETAGVIEDIRRARPHLLLVAMGNPLQERWIDAHRDRLGVPVAMGIGGLIDYWGGRNVRAPGWMRHFGIEWMHILARQPYKAGRYLLGNPKFLYRAVAHRVGNGL